MGKEVEDLKRKTSKLCKKELRIEVPIPVSVNHMYRPVKGGKKTLTKQALDYVRTARAMTNLFVEEQGWKLCDEDEWLYCDIIVYMPDRKIRDSHNMLKLLFDSLQGIVYKNDYFVMPRIQSVEYDKSNPRLDVIFSHQQDKHRKKALSL